MPQKCYYKKGNYVSNALIKILLKLFRKKFYTKITSIERMIANFKINE